MTTPLVLTFIGRDRPGLVNAISHKVAAAGGSWLESRLARLAGEFAGIVLVAVPEANIAGFSASLGDLEASGLRVTLERSAQAREPAPGGIVELSLLGNDRPGIVREITQALAELSVNIEEFTSGVEAAPFSGTEMFHASARLRVPEDLSGDELRRKLERLAGEMMVDLTMTERQAKGEA
jgi:glycine cleavage system regulatory protein